MKTIFFLFLMIPLFSFGPDETFKDGKYTNPDEMVYAVEIFENGSKIRMYLHDSETDNATDKKIFVTGEIVKIKYKYFVQRLIGTHFSKRRQQELEIKMEGTAVVFRKYNVMNNFYEKFPSNFDELKFQYQSN